MANNGNSSSKTQPPYAPSPNHQNFLQNNGVGMTPQPQFCSGNHHSQSLAPNGRRQGEASRAVEGMERSGPTIEGGEELEPNSRVQGKQSRTGAGPDRLKSDYPKWDNS
ncbi:hypothetical protein VIGAN_03000500 [Vigna angularis var. angularis]|uniref:Uncharacterized protein n=1 Tax=Vigna angularis var. angularis TaxID=157739 RepID=A0A0S3RIN7_PHAAN|nr:hypothetical protein VIGAN_03000500 [Vigna angularis var. angularis]